MWVSNQVVVEWKFGQHQIRACCEQRNVLKWHHKFKLLETDQIRRHLSPTKNLRNKQNYASYKPQICSFHGEKLGEKKYISSLHRATKMSKVHSHFSLAVEKRESFPNSIKKNPHPNLLNQPLSFLCRRQSDSSCKVNFPDELCELDLSAVRRFKNNEGNQLTKYIQ